MSTPSFTHPSETKKKSIKKFIYLKQNFILYYFAIRLVSANSSIGSVTLNCPIGGMPVCKSIRKGQKLNEDIIVAVSELPKLVIDQTLGTSLT
jgi:hypothetical protein